MVCVVCDEQRRRRREDCVCVYIHMCVCACHCTHMQSEMTCVLARALGEPVWLVCCTQSCHLSRLDQHWHFHYTSPTTYMLEYALVLQSCVHTDIHTYVHMYVRTYIRTYIHKLHSYVHTYISMYWLQLNCVGGYDTVGLSLCSGVV